jgi:hypothetical protein
MTMLSRVTGWEDILAQEVERARHEPYRLGRHDCAIWAARVVARITGQDFGAGLAGGYSSKSGAMRLMRELGGNLREAVTRRVGQPTVPPLQVPRGGPALWMDAKGEEHLGVCLGDRVATLATDGLSFVSLGDCACGWRL